MEAIMVPDSDSTKVCTLGDLGHLEVLLAITREQIVSANLLPLTELRQCFRYSGSVRGDGEIGKKHGWEELQFDWFHGKATIDESDLRDLTGEFQLPRVQLRMRVAQQAFQGWASSYLGCPGTVSDNPSLP
jgi:hypothetical protein